MIDANALVEMLKSVSTKPPKLKTGRSVVFYTKDNRRTVCAKLADQWKKLGAVYNPTKISNSSAGQIDFPNGVYCFAKPDGAATAVNLKPQAFGVCDKALSPKDYEKALMDGIAKAKLDGALKEYLVALLKYRDGSAKSNAILAKMWADAGGVFPDNEIIKDYAECLGPLQVVENKLWGCPKDAKVFIPSRPNEPLLDYKLVTPKREWHVSAKAESGVSNVVKPSDILGLLAKRPNHKWKGKPEFQLIEALGSGSIITSPIIAGCALSAKFKEFKGLDKGMVQVLLKDGPKTNPKIFVGYAANNATLKTKRGKFALGDVTRECERSLTAITKTGPLNITPMFIDAVSEMLFYLKFGLNRGVPSWTAVTDAELAQGRSYLRSKNSANRFKDRMGVQLA